MSAPPVKELSPCNRDRLIRYLEAELSAAEQSQLEGHLNECGDCRSAIERLAADGAFWTFATKALDHSADEINLSSPDAFAHLSLGALASRADSPPHDTWHSDLASKDAVTESSLSQAALLERWLDPSDAIDSVGRLGKYEVQGIVGQGGMGLVLKAFDTELNRWVALKTLAHHIAPQRSLENSAGLRLAREARAAAALRHPNVIAIYGLETWRSVPLIVMPLVEGGTLQQYAATRPLQIEQALATAIQIASALAALHAAGIVHRDLKPSNILLQGDLDHVLISDFGLARIDGDVSITHSNALAGTPFFMSPEQALGKPIDFRSDLFSFGCVLFWMFSGRYPFRGESNYETLSRLIHTEPDYTELNRRQVPDYLQRLIQRLLAKDPSARWQSAIEVLQLLQASAQHFKSAENPLPLELVEPANQPKATQPTAIKQRTLVALSLVLACVIGAAIYRSTFAVKQDQTVTASEDATANSTSLENRVRYGALDELDRRAMFDDFGKAKNLHYWLRRMAYLPVEDIPPDALPAVQTFSENSDPTIRELAAVILNKNPFQEIHVIQTPTQPDINTMLASPFVEVPNND